MTPDHPPPTRKEDCPWLALRSKHIQPNKRQLPPVFPQGFGQVWSPERVGLHQEAITGAQRRRMHRLLTHEQYEALQKPQAQTHDPKSPAP